MFASVCFNIKMTSISLVTLLLVLLVKSVHCDIWSYITLYNSVNLTVINTFNCDSKIFCATRCSASYSGVVVTVQDGVCYCLNLTPSGFGDQINVPSVFARKPEECILKGYQILPDLGICVKYSKISANWEDAKDHCNQDGGYLININTDEKFTTIYNMTEAYAVDLIHVGGFAVSLPSNFTWTRGGNVDKHWVFGEPNGLAVERCMAIYKGQGGFADLPCSYNRPFICEILF